MASKCAGHHPDPFRRHRRRGPAAAEPDLGKGPGDHLTRARRGLHRPDRRRRGPPARREPCGNMTAQPALAAALERQPPPLGGFRPAIVRLEVRRLLRNRRTMILALLLPVLFFWGFGLNSSYVHERAGHGNVTAVVMISIALYGTVSATATCRAMVSIERAAGWSLQLRVTPLFADRLHRDQDADIAGTGGRRGRRRLPGGRRHEQGVDAGGPVGDHRAVRVDRIGWRGKVPDAGLPRRRRRRTPA